MLRAGSQNRRTQTHQLLERDWELAAIERRFAMVQAGTGALTYIEGEPGSGKTRLALASEELAVRAGLRVLAGRAAGLEHEFPFGVVIQLFEPVWLAADSEQRSAWLSGPAQHAGELFAGSTSQVPDGGRHYPIIHGLFWMMRQLKDPLAILVDDVHWSDVASLRFLAYLAERVRQLPVAIVLTAGLGEVGTEAKALASLRRIAEGSVLRPSPLSPAAVTTIVHRQFPGADVGFCEACARISAGNPFLLLEFLEKLREEEKPPHVASTEGLADVLPARVTAAMAARLDAMPGPARALACATAALGGASLRQAAAVAEIDEREAAGAADALAGSGLLAPGLPLSFVHPLLREAVLGTLSPLERSRLHSRVAQALADAGAGADEIAVHLLQAPPGHGEAAITLLREAAASALEAGRSEDAAALLDRGLAEQPGDELRAALVLARSDLLYAEYRYAEAAELLHAELGKPSGAEEPLAAELDAAYVDAASLAPGGARASRPVRARMLARLAAEPSPRQRRALAHSLVYESLLGLPRADVRRLAELAWDDGALLANVADGALGFLFLSAALITVDELETVLELSDALLLGQIEGHGRIPRASVRACRAYALAEHGQLGLAAAEANSVLAEPADRRRASLSIAEATLALCHLERGELEPAEAALERLDGSALPEPIRHPVALELRARLRLAQHRPAEALSDALEAGEAIRSEFEATNPGALAWRSTAALARLALGQADEARRLAGAELEEARRVGATRAVIRALRILGLSTGGSDGTELLSQAVQLGATSPPRLEYIHALVDLGGGLRRTNRRADAREPLQRGLELAELAEATVLVRRARTELLATSSRRDMLTLSGPESLTASQHRVAELAARGLTTREIAETLFVRPKTVEFHLRQIYRKLDIVSRSELADALYGEERSNGG